jgi:hypothetical protein
VISPSFQKNYENKQFLRSYVINFHKIFLPICIGIFIFFLLFTEPVMRIFFGENYTENSTLLLILLIGFNFGMLTRNLYGNLLPAVGKIEINTWVSVGSLVLLSVLAYLLVPLYGLIGMGIAMSSTLLISGFIYLLFFFSYLKKLS